VKVLLKYEPGKGPFLTDSLGNQRVIALISNDFDNYVVFSDSLNSSTYIERVINKFLDSFASRNLSVISSEEEYFAILSFCVDNEIIKKV
jgi:hypothetical protein